MPCRSWPDGRIIALVCDGMGGARAGNVASTMAVELFMEQLLSRKGGRVDRERMQQAAAQANDEVFHRRSLDDGLRGDGHHPGGSSGRGTARRLSSTRGTAGPITSTQEGIARVTRDHSLVEDMVERGELTRRPGPHPSA